MKQPPRCLQLINHLLLIKSIYFSDSSPGFSLFLIKISVMASSSSLTRTHTLGITDKTFIVRNVWNFLLNRFPSLHRYSVWYQSTSHLDFLMTQHKSLLFPLTQFWHKDLRSRGNQSVYFQNAQKGGWRDCQWDFWKSSFRGRNNDQKNINSIRPHGATLLEGICSL